MLYYIVKFRSFGSKMNPIQYDYANSDVLIMNYSEKSFILFSSFYTINLINFGH